MNVTFYTFAKNPDSTARPTGGTGKSVRLKDSTSMLHPTLEMDRFSYNHDWNYAYIPDFGRYYFISDTVYDGPIAAVSMNVDALASWKTQIGASTQYILRSASSFNGAVVDNLYPVIQEVSDNTSTDGGYPTVSNGCFVIGISGSDANIGSVAYYAFSYANVSTFMSNIMNYITDASMFEVGTGFWFTKEFYLWFVDPLGKIVSVSWFPYDYSSISGTVVSSVHVGDWPVSATAKLLNATVMQGGGTVSKTFTIPQHPQAASRGTYMNLEPFTKHEIVWEPFGIIPIDSTLLAGQTSLNCSLRWDWATGQGWVEGYSTSIGGTIHDVFRRNGRVGVPIQLSKQTYDFIGGMSSALQTASSAVTGDVLGGVAAIGSAAKAMKPDMESVGANGNFAAYAPSNIPRLVTRFYTAAADDVTRRGRPLMASAQISTLSGFVQCDRVELDLPATSEETAGIKGQMEAGFFYE